MLLLSRSSSLGLCQAMPSVGKPLYRTMGIQVAIRIIFIIIIIIIPMIIMVETTGSRHPHFQTSPEQDPPGTLLLQQLQGLHILSPSVGSARMWALRVGGTEWDSCLQKRAPNLVKWVLLITYFCPGPPLAPSFIPSQHPTLKRLRTISTLKLSCIMLHIKIITEGLPPTTIFFTLPLLLASTWLNPC